LINPRQRAGRGQVGDADAGRVSRGSPGTRPTRRCARSRRDSFEPIDLFHAHIGGMDAFAHGLKIAAAMRKDGVLKDMLTKRYSSWDSDWRRHRGGKVKFEELEAYMLKKGDVEPNVSGRQELIENIINRYLK
jgi:xylose isomerase